MILQLQRFLRGMRFIRAKLCVRSIPNELFVVLNQHAILKNCCICRPGKFSILETRCFENNIVRLPFARLPRSIYQRGILAVDGGSLAIGICRVLVRIEYLDFVAAHEKNTAVPPVLAGAADYSGRCPFDVKLHISKFLFRVYAAHVVHDFGIAVLDLPFGRGLLTFQVGDPLGKILAVEQHDRVRRRHGVLRAWRDHGRMRTLDVVNAPFASRQKRRVVVSERVILGGECHGRGNEK